MSITGDYLITSPNSSRVLNYKLLKSGSGGVNVVVSSADGDQVKQAELITNAASQDPSA